MFTVTTLEHAPLEALYIYFDTATFDEIERDAKVAFDVEGFFSMIFR